MVNFDSIEEHAEVFKDVDIGFCALGTTRSKSGKVVPLPLTSPFLLPTAAQLSVCGTPAKEGRSFAAIAFVVKA